MSKFDWRAHLKVHPAADMFPLRSEDEIKELAASIKDNGLQVPIVLLTTAVLDENGRRTDVYEHQLFDGRSRLDALAMLGWLEPSEKPKKATRRGLSTTIRHAPIQLVNDEKAVNIDDADLFRFVDGNSCGSDGDSYSSMAASLNVHRRHLTVEQKRDVIAKLLKANPETSDRAIAKSAKVDNKTVAKVRAEME
jgi:hypothetical protein